MRPGVRLAAFAAVLALAGGGGAVLGATVGPEPDRDPPAGPSHGAGGFDHRPVGGGG